MALLLTTARLHLRELTEADAEPLYRLNANPNVTRYLGEPALMDCAEALAILRTRIFPQYRDHGVGRWAVVAKADGAFLGWCGLKYLPEKQAYDLAYRFFEEHWSRGYATEAAAAVLAWARDRLPGARITATAMPDHAASIRVLEKLGLRLSGRDEDEGGPIVLYALP